MFGDRRSPKATRIHFALASIEDAILEDVETSLRAEVNEARFITYMFDGCVAWVNRADIPLIRDVLSRIGDVWHVEFTVSKF